MQILINTSKQYLNQLKTGHDVTIYDHKKDRMFKQTWFLVIIVTLLPLEVSECHLFKVDLGLFV